MALVAGEFLSGGRVVDAFGRDSLKAEAINSAASAGSYISGGVRRDSDGRICVAVEALNAALTAGTYRSGGRLFDQQGRLIVAVSSVALVSGEVLSAGEVTDNKGRVVVTNEVLGAAYSAGDINTGGGARSSLGRRLVAGAAAAATYAAAVLADSPSMYLKLNEASGPTAADSSGNSHPGTYSGVGVTYSQAGATTDGATAVLLDDGNGVITSSFNPFGGGSVTFEGWANRNPGTSNDALMGGGASGPYLRMTASSASVDWDADVSGGAAQVTWAAAWPGNNQWVHWALTYTTGTGAVELFINKISKGILNAGTFNATPGNIEFGRRNASSDLWGGLLQHNAVYPSVLSSARIAAHYDAR